MKPKLSDIYHPGQKVTFLDVEWTVTVVQDESYDPYLNQAASDKSISKPAISLARVIPGGEVESISVTQNVTDLVKPKAGVTSSLAAAVQKQYGKQELPPSAAQGRKPHGGLALISALGMSTEQDAYRGSIADLSKSNSVEYIATSIAASLKKMGFEIRPITDPK
jgi:hypothetical protein